VEQWILAEGRQNGRGYLHQVILIDDITITKPNRKKAASRSPRQTAILPNVDFQPITPHTQPATHIPMLTNTAETGSEMKLLAGSLGSRRLPNRKILATTKEKPTYAIDFLFIAAPWSVG